MGLLVFLPSAALSQILDEGGVVVPPYQSPGGGVVVPYRSALDFIAEFKGRRLEEEFEGRRLEPGLRGFGLRLRHQPPEQKPVFDFAEQHHTGLRGSDAVVVPPRGTIHFLKKETSGHLQGKGIDFFQPETYKAWADQWHAEHPEDNRTHILFEARGKTELSAAFNLMKALASDSENYRVTYLSPGGLWVHRNGRTLILEPGEEKNEGDVVQYENALRPSDTDKLTSAGVNVVFKSMFTNQKEWFDHHVLPKTVHDADGGIAVGGDLERERYGDDTWADTVGGKWRAANLPPVDYVVVDGSTTDVSFSARDKSEVLHGAARFFVQLAEVPGAIWCGNFQWTFRGAGLNTAKAPRTNVFTNGPRPAREMFTAIFVAHFLDWSHSLDERDAHLPIRTLSPFERTATGL